MSDWIKGVPQAPGSYWLSDGEEVTWVRLTEDSMGAQGTHYTHFIPAETPGTPKKSLAERAVACKGWKWMPGMRWETVEGNAGRGRIGDLMGYSKGGPAEMIPVLDDPATLGCVLHLVREAYGELTWGIDYNHTHNKWSCNNHTGWCADIEAEALIIALENA